MSFIRQSDKIEVQFIEKKLRLVMNRTPWKFKWSSVFLFRKISSFFVETRGGTEEFI